jgi:hypothetical protein
MSEFDPSPEQADPTSEPVHGKAPVVNAPPSTERVVLELPEWRSVIVVPAQRPR